MYICYETIPFDTEFCAPENCPRNGDVDCKVIAADCRVVERWDHWATIVARLLLRIRVRSCKCDCSFTKEVETRQTVWMEHDLLIEEGRVTAAICRCVINDGRIHCHATARCRFVLKKHHGCHRCHPCHPCRDYHPCRECHPCRDYHPCRHDHPCGHDREEGWEDESRGNEAEERHGCWHDEDGSGSEEEDRSKHKEKEAKQKEHHGPGKKSGCC